ncbi:substrate-binding domain-containing protein [Rhodovibrio salinarum]|uniref:Sulfate transporter n=1 Tax=Rhodovibrio salinarum TaxID=1087 RepID=A0A934QJL0_9PROT|nr:substrate-binding domain-containing protein [Rhodovibrio salinarum]MBK1698061.1 sulfate transporter [Rhodovibrio salinarum]
MTLFKRLGIVLGAVALAIVAQPIDSTQAQDDRFIIVQSTTSTEASGLFEYLLPKFENMTGIDVRVVAVGTGQAIRNARNGDGDVLFVHHTPSEYKFVADGHGKRRFDVMYNDFVIVGPEDDPAGISEMDSVTDALTQIAESGEPFASRGDDSGTHKKELGLWSATDVNPQEDSGDWYRETGSGMGKTLNTAVQMGAYTMSDRATWLNFGNKDGYDILVEGDPRLFNQYGVMVLDPEQHPDVKEGPAQAFVDWLVSADGQQAIGNYRLKGEQAFFPNAN